MTAAIYRINHAINKIVKVGYSTKRRKPDQSPYESLESGMASCTGLSILLTDAFRAVGIPARVAGTPQWTTKPGNHNWVKVWIDGQWHFTEYYPDAKGLDHGWLLADAGKADPDSLLHRIYASSFAPTYNWFPLVWDLRIRWIYAEDVTERYINLFQQQQNKCRLAIQVFDTKGGQRVPIEVTLKNSAGKVAGKLTSPGPRDDLNKLPEFYLAPESEYSLGWVTPDGKSHQRKITAGKRGTRLKTVIYLDESN